MLIKCLIGGLQYNATNCPWSDYLDNDDGTVLFPEEAWEVVHEHAP